MESASSTAVQQYNQYSIPQSLYLQLVKAANTQTLTSTINTGSTISPSNSTTSNNNKHHHPPPGPFDEVSYKRFKFTNGALENKSKPQNALQKMQTRFRIAPAKPKNKKSALSSSTSNAQTSGMLGMLSVGTPSTSGSGSPPYETTMPHGNVHYTTIPPPSSAQQTGQTTATITITPASDDGSIKRVQLVGMAGHHTFDVQVPTGNNVQGAPIQLVNVQLPQTPSYQAGTISHHHHHPNPHAPTVTPVHAYELNFEIPHVNGGHHLKESNKAHAGHHNMLSIPAMQQGCGYDMVNDLSALDEELASRMSTAQELFGDSLALTSHLPEHNPHIEMGFNELLALPDFCLNELEKFVGGSPEQTSVDDFLLLN